jgi:hypothetical protein
MPINRIGALAAAIILATISQVVAKDGGVPNIDLQKQCRSSQRTTEHMLGRPLPDAFDRCIKSEQAARDALIKVWETASASIKAQCGQPNAYSPSYVEWLTCGEMERDVRALRKEQPRSVRADRGCPNLQYDEDGSIASVDACPVPNRLLY